MRGRLNLKSFSLSGDWAVVLKLRLFLFCEKLSDFFDHFANLGNGRIWDNFGKDRCGRKSRGDKSICLSEDSLPPQIDQN